MRRPAGRRVGRPEGPAILATLVLGLLGPAAAQAQRAQSNEPQWWISAVASTLGLGGELSGKSNPVVGIRGGYFLFGWSTSDEIEGIRYDLSPKLRNGTALLDLFPGGGWFRLSGGIVYGTPEVKAVAQLSGPVTIGNTTYPAAAVGSLTGRAWYEKGVRPYAGIGIASSARFTVTFDVGVVFSGYPSVTLTADSPLTGAALEQLQQDVAAEQAAIEEWIRSTSWAKYYPVVSLGVKLRL